METLQSLADVVYDPWIEQVPLRLLDGEKLAARIREDGADILIVESDFVNGPVFDLRPARDRLVPRRPQQRRRRGRDRGRHPGARARRAATPTPSPRSRSRCCSRSTASSCPPTATCGPARCTRDGKIPYQRYRAWQLAGRTVGLVGLGAVGRGDAVAARGPRHARARRTTRTTRTRRTPSLDEMLPECDVVSMHAVGHARDRTASWARRSSRAMKEGAIYVNTRPRRSCTTSTRSPPRSQSGHLGGAGLDHFEGEHLPTDHPLCAMHERRADAAHRRRDLRHRSEPLEAHRRRRRAHPARRQAGPLREPGGARSMAELKGTAEEIKAELLWVAQESLRTNLVHGTAGNFSARLPDGNVVLTPSSLDVRDDDARRPRRHRPRRQRARRRARSPTTEKMLHLACLKAYDDIHAVIHCHAKFCTMFAITHQPIPCVIEEVDVFVGGDVPVAELRVHRVAGARRRGLEVGRRPRRGAHGEPRAADRRQVAARTR